MNRCSRSLIIAVSFAFCSAVNNWNISGYVGKIWEFQSLVYAVAPEPGQPEVFEFSRIRVFNNGPWAEIKDQATRERRLNVRPVIVQALERQPDGTQQLVTYTKFRAADLRVGNTVVPVIWDEAVTASDGTLRRVGADPLSSLSFSPNVSIGGVSPVPSSVEAGS